MYPSKLFFASALLSVAFLTACNAGPYNPVNGGGGGGKGGGGGGGGGGGNGSPTPVTVSASSITTGVNVAVVAPQSSTPPNAIALGVNQALDGADSTGDTVSRSLGTSSVAMYGQGLNASMVVTISGPSDITVGPLTAITSTGGIPGVVFPVTLTGTSALGARTVIMQNGNGDTTTFTGGLEVIQ